MSNSPRVFHTFMSHAAVSQPGPVVGGVDYQIGDPIVCWIGYSDGRPPLGVEGYLIGIHLDVDTPTWDVAFPVAGHPDLYVPARSLSCRITKRELAIPGAANEQIPIGERQPEEASQLIPDRRKPTLALVADNTQPAVDKDTQLARDEAAASVELESSELPSGDGVEDNTSVVLEYPARYFEEMRNNAPEGAAVRAPMVDGDGLTERFAVFYPSRKVMREHLAAFLRLRPADADGDYAQEIELGGPTKVIRAYYPPKMPAHG